MTKNPSSSPNEVAGLVSNWMMARVNTTPIGSLLPDSSSSRLAKVGGSFAFLARSTMNTAAASVEETIAPSKSPSRNDHPWTTETNHPTKRAVSNTPMVDSDKPFHSTSRTLAHSVSSPPENRINTSAITPSVCTSWGLSKYRPPGPSEPASIPITRNSTSDGIPKRTDSLIVKILRMMSAEKIMNRASMDVGIVFPRDRASLRAALNDFLVVRVQHAGARRFHEHELPLIEGIGAIEIAQPFSRSQFDVQLSAAGFFPGVLSDHGLVIELLPHPLSGRPMVLVERAVRRRRCGPHGCPAECTPLVGFWFLIPGNVISLPPSQHKERTVVRHLFDQGIADQLRLLEQLQTARRECPLQRNAPPKLPGLFEYHHAPGGTHGVRQTVETGPQTRAPLKCRLCRRVVRPLKAPPTRARKAGILFGLNQRMRGDNTVICPARGTCVHIRVLEPHILEMENLGFSLGRGNGRARTVDTDHPRVGIAAGVKRRENPGAAAEIKNRGGVAKPLCDERSDGRIVAVSLAVEDRQNPWGSRKIVECGFVLTGSLP